MNPFNGPQIFFYNISGRSHQTDCSNGPQNFFSMLHKTCTSLAQVSKPPQAVYTSACMPLRVSLHMARHMAVHMAMHIATCGYTHVVVHVYTRKFVWGFLFYAHVCVHGHTKVPVMVNTIKVFESHLHTTNPTSQTRYAHWIGLLNIRNHGRQPGLA